MKKLKFEEGAVAPFWLKDLEYMQEGFEETIKAVIEGLSLGKKDMLISGCKITTTNSKISMTSGWCYYDGEILPVQALQETSYTVSSPKIKFTKATEIDRTGTRTAQKESGQIRSEVYQIDYLIPSLYDGATVCQLAISQGAWDLGTRIANMNNLKDTGIVRIKVEDSVSQDGYIQYRQIGGVVQLYGQLTMTSSLGDIITTKLPVPAVETHWKFNEGVLHIGKNGLRSDVFNGTVFLDGIMYLSDQLLDSGSDGHHILDAIGGGGGGTLS